MLMSFLWVLLHLVSLCYFYARCTAHTIPDPVSLVDIISSLLILCPHVLIQSWSLVLYLLLTGAGRGAD